ncbi:PBSX family phage terminase large subunit [soil metagenome]
MPKEPKVLDAYEIAFLTETRYLLLMGGAGSGKSYFAAQKILQRMRTENDHRFVVVRKIARTIRNSVYQQMKDVIRNEGWEEEFKFSESRLEIEHTGKGSTLITTGVDDPEKLKSLAQPTGIWIEEATELSARDFRQLDLRLRGETGKYLQIIFTFNPISKKNFIYKEFYTRDEAEMKNVYKLETTHKDNEMVGDSFKEMLAEMEFRDPEYYKIYALAQWGENSNAIIYNYKLISRMPEMLDEVLYGLDFGFNNPCALIRVGHYEKDIYLEEVFYKRKLTTPQIIELMQTRQISETDYIYADSANPDKIKELQQSHFAVRAAEKSVFNGINKVKEYRIHVVQNSTHLLNELDNYVWKTDHDGNLLDDPEKRDDHACDAIRYAIYSHLGKRKQSVIWGHSG